MSTFPESVRVLQLASTFDAVALAGAEFIAAGHDVTLVEPPSGHPLRTRFPQVHGVGTLFAATAAGASSTVVDTDAPEEVDRLVAAAGAADVVLAGEDAGSELLAALAEVTLLGVVSGWGPAGPWKGRPASEATVQALTGYGSYLGERRGRPRRVGADVAQWTASRLLLHGLLAALLCGRRPERLEVSLLGAASAQKTIMWAARTDPDEWAGFHLLGAERPPEHGWATSGGPVTIDFMGAPREGWDALVARWGIAGSLPTGDDGTWQETLGLGDLVPQYREVYERATSGRTRDEVVAEVRAAGGTAVPYLSYDEVLADTQVAQERAFVTDVALGRHRVTRVRPVADRLGTDQPRHVPRLGAHELPVSPVCNARPPRSPGQGPPLAGLQIVDFSMGAVGPWATALLGRLGADVVKVDSPRGDFILGVGPRSHGRATTYASLNVGKRCVTLDARDPDDAATVRGLVAGADVVVENFRPGTMARLGLSYEKVSGNNPGLVYLSATGYGQQGPLAGLRCTDPHMQAFSGFASANATVGSQAESLRYFAVLDMVTALCGAELILFALLERQRTGRGQRRTISMLRAGLALQSRNFQEHLAGQVDPSAFDSALETADGWLAVTAGDDAGFRRLVTVLGCPELAERPDFVDERQRRRDSGRLLDKLDACTRRRPTTWWLRRMARAGVAAAPHLDDEAVMAHRQIRAARGIEPVRCGDATPLEVSATPWTFQATRLAEPGDGGLPAAGLTRAERRDSARPEAVGAAAPGIGYA